LITEICSHETPSNFNYQFQNFIPDCLLHPLHYHRSLIYPGNTKWGIITVTLTDLLFDWFGLDCLVNKAKIVTCHTDDSKPVKQEVNGTVILPPLVLPDVTNLTFIAWHFYMNKSLKNIG
jgi:hypothetical protein